LAWVIAVDRFDPFDRDAFVRLVADDPLAAAYVRSKPRACCGVALSLADVRRVVVPAHRTPRKVRTGWVADFNPGDWKTIA
jgi:hypothetical protein